MGKKNLQLECMFLFQANPKLKLSANEIGTKLGRNNEEVQQILEILIHQGIIEQSKDADGAVFCYKEPATIVEFGVNNKLEKL
ncbi:hypothetical protein [Sediminibacillus massiliensis]|uniref:hypothetical protein n=1 Tax=Sediminibacillus massiliensis TaxID=1926277 RepID=UPI0009884A3F|nr:hypothetical protein [Sediminibacillus massiliensis]